MTIFQHYNINISENGSFSCEVIRVEKRDLENTVERLNKAFPTSDGFEIEVYGIPYETKYKVHL